MDHAVDTNGDLVVMGPRPSPKQGYLDKQGGGTSMFGSTSWKKRFFDLTGGILTW